MKRISFLQFGIAVLIAVLLGACSGEAPEIVRLIPLIQYVDDRAVGERYERLQIYVLAEDRNGIEDIELLYLIHDDSDSYWRLDSDNWSSIERDGLIWLGSSGLVMERHRQFPRSEYRLLVIDAAGESAEQNFRLTAEELLADVSFPSLSLDESNLLVGGNWPRVVIRGYTLQGAQVGEYSGTGGTVALTELFADGRSPTGLEFWVYAPRRDGPLSISGPYRF